MSISKSEEIEILRATAEKLGGDSYMGPWLKDQLGRIEMDIQGDIFPISMREGDRIASSRISDAEMGACKILKEASDKAVEIVREAERQKTKVFAEVDSWRAFEKKQFEEDLHAASYAAGAFIKKLNELC